MEYTTIMIDVELKKMLDSLKVHHRESYNELLKKIIEEYTEDRRLKEFVKNAQRRKMNC
ncbi:MAG: hypothetical protein ACPL06_01690 [Candidatus Anstonellales archaeon]